MIRRPPRSTLFPYTRSSDLGDDHDDDEEFDEREACSHRASRGFHERLFRCGVSPEFLDPHIAVARSEEHTSELQSRRDLVCRLLLEKKKNKENKKTEK